MTIETMTIKQAERIVRLCDEMRVTFDELAELYHTTPQTASLMYDFASVLVLHSEVLRNYEMLNDLNRQIADAYDELCALYE